MMCMPGAHGGEKMVLDALELELQETVSYRVGAGKQTRLEHTHANVSQRPLTKEGKPTLSVGCSIPQAGDPG